MIHTELIKTIIGEGGTIKGKIHLYRIIAKHFDKLCEDVPRKELLDLANNIVRELTPNEARLLSSSYKLMLQHTKNTQEFVFIK